ncbi:hyaluronan / mRNA binding family protein [Cooperia oncophora]
MVEYGCNVANKFGFMSDDDEFDDPQELISRVTQLEAEKAAAQKKADKLAKQAAVAPKEPLEKKTVSQPAANVAVVAEVVVVELGDPVLPALKESFLNVSEKRVEAEEVAHAAEVVVAALHSEDVVEVPTLSQMLQRTSRIMRMKFPVNYLLLSSKVSAEGEVDEELSTESEEDAAVSVVDVSSIVRVGQTVRVFVEKDKKGGYGRGNWGDVKDELAGETEPIALPEEPEVPREKTAEELAQEALEAEFAKQKTLKEYIEAQKKEAPKFNVRKAGEGEEENFGKLVKLQKEVVVDKEEEEVSIIRREPREKALHIDIQFAEPNRGFRGDRPPRGRGARGGGRGARGGGPRAQPPPQFDSSLDAFPALGSK